MKGLCIALLLILASPANAKDIVLPLNEREQAALRELLNIAVKAGGLEAAPAALHIVNKMQTLLQPPEQPPAAPAAPN